MNTVGVNEETYATRACRTKLRIRQTRNPIGRQLLLDYRHTHIHFFHAALFSVWRREAELYHIVYTDTEELKQGKVRKRRRSVKSKPI